MVNILSAVRVRARSNNRERGGEETRVRGDGVTSCIKCKTISTESRGGGARALHMV